MAIIKPKTPLQTKSAKSERAPRAVGIKELKDRASALIDSVERTGQPVTITRNNRVVARIIPALEEDPLQILRDMGMIAQEPRGHLRDLKLIPLAIDMKSAVDAIIEDREA